MTLMAYQVPQGRQRPRRCLRAFARALPSAWNAFPQIVHDSCPSFSVYKKGPL